MSLDPSQSPGEDQQEPATTTTGPEQPGPYHEYAPSNTSFPQGNLYPPPPENPYPSLYPGTPQHYYPAPPAPSYGTPLPPLPLVDAIADLPLQYWKILRNPGPRAFAEEAGKAKRDITLVQLFGYILLNGLLSWLYITLHPITAQTLAAANVSAGGGVSAQVQAFELALVNFTDGVGQLILLPVGFLIYQGIAFGIAKAFRGQASFLTQSYTFLLFYVPIGVIDLALKYLPIPVVPDLISYGLGLYEIVLAVFAMMGAHRLTGGKAAAVALLPIVGVLLAACCALFIVLAAAVGN